MEQLNSGLIKQTKEFTKALGFVIYYRDEKLFSDGYIPTSSLAQMIVDYRESGKGWVDIENDLPPHATKVLVKHITSNGVDINTAVYDITENKFRYSLYPELNNGIEVTHWQFLPKQ